MKNADLPVMPSDVKAVYEAMSDSDDSWGKAALGLTKREMMAMHIMCGMQANADIHLSSERMAEESVKAADALLVALESI